MLYIGNFSYTDMDDGSDNYCLMPAVVEAPDAETALERFSDMLVKLHDSSALLMGAQDIYLDSLVELGDAPEEAFVIQWQKILLGDEGMYSELTALPGDVPVADVYTFEDLETEASDESDLEDDELDTLEEAFITFE